MEDNFLARFFNNILKLLYKNIQTLFPLHFFGILSLGHTHFYRTATNEVRFSRCPIQGRLFDIFIGTRRNHMGIKKTERLLRIRECATRYKEGKSIIEIAQSLNITEKQVQSVLDEALFYGLISERRKEDFFLFSKKMISTIKDQLNISDKDIIQLIKEDEDSMKLKVIRHNGEQASINNDQ